jgi:hypothetical protein
LNFESRGCLEIHNREVIIMEKEISRREFLKVTATTGAVLSMAPPIVLAEEQKPIQLIQPQMGSGNPFMQLLWK